MVLFMFGIMGGAYAISFADFFYQADGSAGMGAWGLRGIAVLVGLAGVWRYRQKQNQCSIDPKRQQKNLILLVGLIVVLGVGFFFSLDSLSSWYFDAYIVPAQQLELNVGT
jgi:peptidoglycan/LPS O-acetylase OafA/YrhL